MTDDELVERMAKAIAQSRWDVEEYDVWELTLSPTDKELARKDARAALPAIRDAGCVVVPREPTLKMLHHADGYTDLVGPYKEANTPQERRSEFATAWEVMIDAHLERPMTGIIDNMTDEQIAAALKNESPDI